MKIKKLNFLLLRNNEHFQFFTEFKELVEETSPETLKIAPLFAAWLSLYAQEDEAFKKIMKSAFTADLHVADQKRDETFRGMVQTNRSALKHFKPEVKAASLRLQTVFDTYGNVSVLTLNEETSAVYNLLQELRTEKYAADVQTVGIDDWLAELESNNSAFDRINKDRYDEAALRTGLVMKETRAGVDTSFRKIAERIDALCLIEDTEPCRNFISHLNVVIDKYRNTIALRSHDQTGTERMT